MLCKPKSVGKEKSRQKGRMAKRDRGWRVTGGEWMSSFVIRNYGVKLWRDASRHSQAEPFYGCSLLEKSKLKS